MHRFLAFFFIFSLWSLQIQIEDEILNVEIVDTPRLRAKGLMGRKELQEGTGMLFVYPEPQILTFWMKNTLIPLSVAFFDEEKVLVNISDMDPIEDEVPIPTYSSEGLAQYALEVPQGWFEKNNIGPGAKFSFLDPSF